MSDLLTKLDGLFVNGAIAGVLSILFNLIFFMWLNKFLNRIISKQSWKQKELIKKVKSIVIYTLLVVSIVSQITFLENLTSTLLTSGGIVAVVVGFASQEAASSIVSGAMILVSKPFQIGDTIILKEQNLRGVVKEIKLNHTVIETVEKNLIMIPNTIMNKAIIENITQETEFKTAYLYVDISYESNIHKAIEIMKTTIASHPLYYDTRESEDEEKVIVHCMEFKDSGISLRAKVTTRSVGDSFTLLSDCRILIKENFDFHGIEIPYPHVHIKQDNN